MAQVQLQGVWPLLGHKGACRDAPGPLPEASWTSEARAHGAQPGLVIGFQYWHCRVDRAVASRRSFRRRPVASPHCGPEARHPHDAARQDLIAQTLPAHRSQAAAGRFGHRSLAGPDLGLAGARRRGHRSLASRLATGAGMAAPRLARRLATGAGRAGAGRRGHRSHAEAGSWPSAAAAAAAGSPAAMVPSAAMVTGAAAAAASGAGAVAASCTGTAVAAASGTVAGHRRYSWRYCCTASWYRNRCRGRQPHWRRCGDVVPSCSSAWMVAGSPGRRAGRRPG